MTVPAWGCPWHGLVRNGLLQLPNGQSLPYRQPTTGDTALVRHPLAPQPPTLTLEEQEAGMQWWDRAITAGDRAQLHGQRLGYGNWIYIDPAGDRWLVSTDLGWAHSSGGTCTVTLSRFGVLGGAPQQFEYLVAVPDMGQAEPLLDLTAGERYTVSLRHSSTAGSAAIFEVGIAADSASRFTRVWSTRPVGWVEIELSGLGAECEAVISIRKTRAQTLGPVRDTRPTITPANWGLRGNSNRSYDLVLNPDSSEIIISWVVSHSSVMGPERSGYERYVVAMFYDETGGLHELTLSMLSEGQWNIPETVHSGPTHFPEGTQWTGDWSLDWSVQGSIRMAYALDDEEVAAWDYRMSEQHSHTFNLTNMTSAWDVTANCNPGSALNDQGQKAVSYADGWNPGGTYVGVPAAPQNQSEMARALIRGIAWIREPDNVSSMIILSARYSNQLFGLLIEHFNEANGWQTEHLAGGASPSGAEALSPMTQPGEMNWVYGSYCPVTHAATRDIVPVCYV